MSRLKRNQFEERISNVGRSGEGATERRLWIEEYREDPKEGTVNFTVRSEVDFPMAHAFADILGTDDIKLSPETRNGGYCDTCEHTYGVMEIVARNVRFNNEQ